MELNDLKSLWQNQQPFGKSHSEQDIQTILKNKTNPILKRIYSKVFIEIAISSVMLVVLIGVAIYLKRYELAMMSVLISGIIGVVYWLLYKKININFSLDSLNVALAKMEQLFDIYDHLLKYVRYLMGLGFYLGIGMGYVISKKPFELNMKFVILLSAVVPASIALSYPMKWLVDYIYGQHVRELKAAYVELNDLDI